MSTSSIFIWHGYLKREINLFSNVGFSIGVWGATNLKLWCENTSIFSSLSLVFLLMSSCIGVLGFLWYGAKALGV